jgi:hypothetical protein
MARDAKTSHAAAQVVCMLRTSYLDIAIHGGSACHILSSLPIMLP